MEAEELEEGCDVIAEVLREMAAEECGIIALAPFIDRALDHLDPRRDCRRADHRCG